MAKKNRKEKRVQKVGIVLDKYKFSRFNDLLTKANFKFEIKGDFTKAAVAIVVVCPMKRLVELQQVVKEANSISQTEFAVQLIGKHAATVFKGYKFSVEPIGKGQLIGVAVAVAEGVVRSMSIDAVEAARQQYPDRWVEVELTALRASIISESN